MKTDTKTIIKEGKDTLITLGAATVGFAGANFLQKTAKLEKPLITGALSIAGAYGSVKVKAAWLKSLLLGLAVFFGVKALNQTATLQGLQGTIAGLPQGVKDFINKYVPTLGDMDLIGDDNTIDLSADEYELVSSTLNNSMASAAPNEAALMAPAMNGFGNAVVYSSVAGI